MKNVLGLPPPHWEAPAPLRAGEMYFYYDEFGVTYTEPTSGKGGREDEGSRLGSAA